MMLSSHITNTSNNIPQRQQHQHQHQQHAHQGGANNLDSRQSTGRYDSAPPDIRTSEKHSIVISSEDEDNTSENIARSSNPHKRPMWRTIQRKWTSSPHDRYDTFTVMTYNLLSKKLALKNQQLYNREHYVGFFQPAFQEWGYSGVFKKRNGNKPDGCAIFFRNKTVKAVKLLGVNFDENSFKRKENIGIVGIFDIKHLLCGDFNALPYSTVIRYLTDESIDVSALPESLLSGQLPFHTSHKLGRPPYENRLTEFHRAFPDNGHGFSPTSKAVLAASPTKTNTDSTAATVTATRTTATETTTTTQTQPPALSWSASSLRSLIRKSRSEWNESTESTTNTSTAAIPSSSTSANSTDTKAANTHIVFNSDGSSKTTTTTTTTLTSHASRPGSLICQPFALKSAYPFFPQEEAARALGSNRSPKGGPWTTFHSGGQLVCDYIFHGQLRVPVISTGANPSLSHSSSTSTAAIPQKLQVDGILELPCADLIKKGTKSLPCPEFGSDHLSLVARFKFV
ncbi:Protein angel 2 [Linnemannia hyalina]|uniref:Protein angel 2 n=1 Tax=Linnemannia hyalina TaxID=64524 RepID=A0A9P7XXJ4_9FUNG|nr:Protein angel 2 [Linnemannia hyalina]